MRLRLTPEALLATLLACSASLNLVLAARLYSERGKRLAARSLEEGEKLPVFIARSPDGQAVVLGYHGESRPRVFYVFQPNCSWCEANRANIEALANGAKQQYDLLGICLQSRGQDARECLTSHPLPFAIYVDVSDRSRTEYKLQGTPQTLVVAGDGTVLKNWRGAYTDAHAREIESFFKISLPGLVRPPHGVN